MNDRSGRPMLDPGRLHSLRRQSLGHQSLRNLVTQIEADGALRARRSLRLGAAALDAALGGGLAMAAVHEIGPAAPIQVGAASAFAVALAALAARDQDVDKHAGRHVLWIQQDFAAREAGQLHGPGFALFGLPMPQLIVLSVTQPRDALWAMEEALKSGAVAAVIMELVKNDAGIELTATRRLSLAAAAGGALGLILRHRACDCPGAAATRWEIAAAAGVRDDAGGLGTPAFALSLVKNRHGPTGRWLLSWDRHECVFVASVSLGVAATAGDRSDRAPRVRAG